MKNTILKLSNRLKIWLLIMVASFGSVTTSMAQDSKGTDFWLMFNGNLGTPVLTLFITSSVNTSGTVSGPSFAAIPFTVTANVVTAVVVPNSLSSHVNNTVDNKGIHVIALQEVTVYGLNYITFTTDAYLALPTDVLGTDYIIMDYNGIGRGGEFGIVASQNATIVTITPTSTEQGHPAGVPYNINLNQGETYELLANSASLTGTLVTSNKPVGVFGASICANIPSGASFCDHICEMLPPTDAWGQTFVTVPLKTRTNGDTWRFLASQNNTIVTVNGVASAPIDKGEFIEQILTTQSIISSNNPILVAQFANGSSFSGNPGDPFMMLIPPYEQFLAGYTVTTVTGYVAHFINVVAPNAVVGSLTLDGVAVSAAEFTAIGASGFSGAQLTVLPGSHTLFSTLPFGAFQYGFNNDDSYGYPGGQSFSPVATVNSIVLTPPNGTAPINTNNCWNALVEDNLNNPVAGVRVDFTVTGPNSSNTGFAFTNATGIANFCYTGLVAGSDAIVASIGSLSDNASFIWTAVATDSTLVLTPATGTAQIINNRCWNAILKDDLNNPIVGVQVDFTVTGPNSSNSGSAITNASGIANFCYTGLIVGTDAIVASYTTISDNASFVWTDTSGCCTVEVDAGSDEQTYFGFSADQNVTHTAAVTGGVAPFSYVWTLNRSLLCNQVDASGDELFYQGNCTNNTCPTVGSPGVAPSCTGSSQVTTRLIADGELCVTVTDANGCTFTDCFLINATDARCFTCSLNDDKTTVCHATGNIINPTVELCIYNSDLTAFLAANPLDVVGNCALRLGQNINEAQFGLYVYPNPATDAVNIEFLSAEAGNYQISIFDVTGRLVLSTTGETFEKGNALTIPVNEIARGVYTVKLNVGEKSSLTRLVISK